MESTGQINKGTQSYQNPGKSLDKQFVHRRSQLSQHFTQHLWTNDDILIPLKSIEDEPFISKGQNSPYIFALKNLQST